MNVFPHRNEYVTFCCYLDGVLSVVLVLRLLPTALQVVHNVQFVAAFLAVDILQTVFITLTTTTRDARNKKGIESFIFYSAIHFSFDF